MSEVHKKLSIILNAAGSGYLIQVTKHYNLNLFLLFILSVLQFTPRMKTISRYLLCLPGRYFYLSMIEHVAGLIWTRTLVLLFWFYDIVACFLTTYIYSLLLCTAYTYQYELQYIILKYMKCYQNEKCNWNQNKRTTMIFIQYACSRNSQCMMWALTGIC